MLRMKTERRFLTEDGPEIFTGNELLVKGALEATGGVHLLGGYPGSPIAGYFDSLSVLAELLREKGIRAVINNNEALSAAMVNGTQVLPTRVMIAMKSVGLHVAADALALGNLAGAHRLGGVVIVCGDDPWCDSTQVPADSRYLARHLFMPVVEPSNQQEVKDFIDLSFQLSGQSELYVAYILPTNLADGGGTVICRPNQFPRNNMLHKFDLASASINLDKRVLLPPRTCWQEASFPDRFARAQAQARRVGMNKIEYPVSSARRAELGFVAAGLGHDYLIQAMHELGVLGEVPILKLGLSYPVDPQLVQELARQCRRIVVIEERRGFMEEQIAQIIAASPTDSPLRGAELFGKKFPQGLPAVPCDSGLTPSRVMELIGPLIERFVLGPDSAKGADSAKRSTLQVALGRIQATERVDIPAGMLPKRLPSFCPGCPHRDSASLCLEIKRKFMNPHYMKRKYRRGTVDMIFHGDCGCYTMLMFPPNTELMHDFSGMGVGGATGSGTDPFVPNKEAVFMGDSTFFHSGQLAISQAIKFNQDITFIILDNSTTAMTGHQPTPGVDYDLLGNATARQDIESVVRGLADGTDTSVVRVNPELRGEYRELLEKTFLARGVKVIIAEKECGIMMTRRRRRQERRVTSQKGYLPVKEYSNINKDICRFCLACAELTGCPGLRHVPTDYGLKMDTDLSWCVNDGACQRVGACDAFERITIRRKRPPRSLVPELGLGNIPEPRKRRAGELWRCCLTGVGGMGIGLATSIVVRAGHKEGYNVLFLDKKGLAIRNGGVISQVVYNISNQPITAIMSHGQADLLLGVDILEAARTLDPTNRSRVVDPAKTAAVINTDKIATIPGLMGQADYDPAELAKFIKAHTREDYFLARNISRICEKYLGGKIYANIMMLGYAFQRGLIPVSMHSMAWAIKDAIRVDFRKNLYAFNMGRKLVESPALFLGAPQKLTWRETLDEKCRYTTRRYGKGSPLPGRLRDLLSRAMGELGELGEKARRDLVVRAYDCLRWGGIDYAKRYVEIVTGVYRKDRPEYNLAATQAVIVNLASAMLIKDAFFKAELATSKEKYRSDQEKYNINRANGDRASYRHLWKVKFTLGLGSWKISTGPKTLALPDWVLKALKRMRWLRRVIRPGNSTERRFRARYARLAKAFKYDSAEEYQRQLAGLSSPMCMNCLSPTCSLKGCPLGSEVPVWMALATEGNWKEAARALHEKNNFPEFTGNVCPAFCREACGGKRGPYPADPRATELQIITRAWAKGWITPRKCRAKKRTGKTVAVVGSGPAGLATAQQLARKGHAVTVFEKDPQPGGLLRRGIPAYRLDKALIDRRIEQLQAEGVEFKLGQAVGAEVSGPELMEQFDAVCLAVGASKPGDLALPGRELPGVVQAMDFLTGHGLFESGRAGEIPQARAAEGKRVVVIGGGLSGEDCVEAALQQGARHVYQFEILPKGANQVGLALNESVDTNAGRRVTRRWSVAAGQFLGDDKVTGVAACEVTYTPSARGPVRDTDPQGQFAVDAELVILALGFDNIPEETLVSQFGLALDQAGRIELFDKFRTSIAGVFAAGDLACGASYVATAIDSGRSVAERIDEYLRLGE
jgi:indolepyruvate ferredoxin oxidoreductase